jgi:hypothetical protein
VKPKRDHEVRLPDRFWRCGTHLSLDAKALYAVLATFADYKTGETFVSNARLRLVTGFGRDKIKQLLRELQNAEFISRRRRLRKNLKAERYIRCLKYVCSMDGKSAYRPDGLVSGTHENQPSIFTPVKSSVTPEKQEKSSFPRTQVAPERIM